jgi:inner membrane transporter RhtA
VPTPPATSTSSPLARVPAPALVVGGVVALEGGAAIATRLIVTVGTPATVALRLGFGAIGLGAMSRPRLRGRSRRSIALTIFVGLLLALHHLCFYAAIHRLPLGVAVTVEFAGPLTVSLIGLRRRVDLLWAALAVVGVAASAGLTDDAHIEVAGVLLALAAGACWAAYIVTFPELARQIGRADALALATIVAAIATVPYAVIADSARIFTVHALLLGLTIAAIGDVFAYTLQAAALERMTTALFSILTSTEPAAGALVGLVALGQHLSWWQWTGVLAVTIASIGATRTHAIRVEPGSL